jgi:glycosyltransferase involved in cell wall biosynthesis
MTPKVSVCIDIYNYGRFLPEAVESVLSQAYSDFEVVISDDCSTDNSYEVATAYAQKDSRVRAVRNPQNLGMVKNRNACLALARGEYVKWLHADDFLTSPETISRMAAALDSNPAVSLVASAMQMVSEESQPLHKWSWFEEERPLAGTTVINRCLFEQRNLVGGPSAVMFRRALAARGFDETFFVAADMEMWFHLLEQGCFQFLPEPLCAFRVHGAQQTEKDKRTLQPALENRALLQRYLDRPYVRLRPWIKDYLRHDAVRRVVKRSAKLGMDSEAAVAASGGWSNHRRGAVKQRVRELLLKARRRYERQLRRRASTPAAVTRPLGVNLCGFVQSVYGIGESSRAIWRAVEASGLPCALINIESRVHRNADKTHVRFQKDNPYSVNLMTFSFDYSRRFFRDMGPKFFTGRRNVALWYWEQEKFPARWHSSFDYYDEIWVVTEFTRAAFAAVSPVPVRKITYPFTLDESEARRDRARFSIPEEAYVFLFTFDFFSTTQRKNPEGVVAAFRQAFRAGENVLLVLKSINAESNTAARQDLEEEAKGAKVLFLDSHAPREEMSSLFASADCYVSLHRSEGLGLGMVQAMYLGKPVIATGYSGNLEYMNEQNSLLVRYDMTEMTEAAGAYDPGTHWAEPDVMHAAELMRQVYNNREQAAAIGARAAADIRRQLDPAITAREIAAAVQHLHTSSAAR